MAGFGRFLDVRDFCIKEEIPFKVVAVGDFYILWSKKKEIRHLRK